MIDLHVHSVCSDGTLTPEALAAEAAAAGLSAVALTDHDTTAGTAPFLAACRAAGIEGIPGIELSADVGTEKGSMHLLGYFIDPDDAALAADLEEVRASREVRNATILERLEAAGVGVSPERVAVYAGGGVVGRLHIAQAMIEAGHVPDRDMAFRRYLAKGRPAYVERYRLAAPRCIALIRGAGGVPVLAHPGTLELAPRKLRDRVMALAASGLAGIEVLYSHHTDKQVQRYRGLARAFGLCETGGTDYHGGHTPDLVLGRGFGSLHIPNSLLGPLREAAARG